jgi:uridine kinase
MVLVAGPSCAGKTTFSKRLATHLEANGLRPVTIAADDYFVPPERNPLDEHGNPDYEHLEAVDLDLFNDHMGQLIRGHQVELPHFDFTRKERQYRGDVLQISDDQIIIVEGIHGLNPRLTEGVPRENKYSIYVSALTQLNMDAHNRVSTTDNRLMRRIVRDYSYRGHSSLDTLRLWPSVRRGEKRWIFPFQREADATFNSALDYELAILKPLVEPLLMRVKPTDKEYAEARRLSEFLLNFLPAPMDTVPPTSILREYIGGSGLEY